MKLATLCWVIAGVFLLLGCVNPRAVYWGARAWQYRKPEANEPSEAFYAFQRIGAFASAIVLAIGGWVLYEQEKSDTYDAGDMKEAVSKVVNLLDQDKVPQSKILSPDYYTSVNAAVQQVTGGPLSDLQIDLKGKTEDGGEKFTLSSRSTGNPYCLYVTTGVRPESAPEEVQYISLVPTARKGAC
ncbi:hypothetical protein ABZ769_31395 [Streptomyces olivoreticuli]